VWYFRWKNVDGFLASLRISYKNPKISLNVKKLKPFSLEIVGFLTEISEWPWSASWPFICGVCFLAKTIVFLSVWFYTAVFSFNSTVCAKKNSHIWFLLDVINFSNKPQITWTLWLLSHKWWYRPVACITDNEAIIGASDAQTVQEESVLQLSNYIAKLILTELQNTKQLLASKLRKHR